MTAPDPRQDLGVYAVVAGDPVSWPIQIQLNGVGTDLTALATGFVADLRQSAGSLPEFAFTVDSTNAATGTLVLSLTGTQTATMLVSAAAQPSPWGFNLQLTGGAVTPQTIGKGQVLIFKGYI